MKPQTPKGASLVNMSSALVTSRALIEPYKINLLNCIIFSKVILPSQIASPPEQGPDLSMGAGILDEIKT